MQLIEQSNNKNKNIAIVCCQHGVEIFGLEVFKYFKEHISNFPTVKIILANEKAVIKQTRFIDEDLNRAFNKETANTYENRLAKKISAEISNIQYVLDIHTTTSKTNAVPIITKLNQDTKKIINLTPYQKISYIQSPLGKHSLIGQVAAGVSLEFNEKYTKISEEALNTIIKIVKNLTNEQEDKKQKRQVYFVDQTIPLKTNIKLENKNFNFIPNLKIYPLLLREKYYTNIQGFSASQMEEMEI